MARVVTMTDAVAKPSNLEMLKKYALLAYGAFGTVMAVSLMALGVVLVGLAIPVLLHTFGLVDIGIDLTTGPLLISAVILGVAGLFCLGLASESPLVRGRRLYGYKLWEVGIGRTLAALAMGFALILLYRVAIEFLDGLPEPLLKGAEAVRAAGVAGMVAVPLIGVPVSLLVRAAPTEREWIKRLDLPAMFVVWTLAIVVIL